LIVSWKINGGHHGGGACFFGVYLGRTEGSGWWGMGVCNSFLTSITDITFGLLEKIKAYKRKVGFISLYF